MKTRLAILFVAAIHGLTCQSIAAPHRYEIKILASLEGPTMSSSPASISEGGVIVGQSDRWNGNSYLGPRAARWDAPDDAVELETLPSLADRHSFSWADDINSQGLVVGTAGVRATYWLSGQTSPNLLPELEDYDQINVLAAHAVNDDGVIAGAVRLAAGQQFAVKWPSVESSPMRLPDGQYAGQPVGGFAVGDLNNSGIIVGTGLLNYNIRDNLPLAWDAADDVYVLPLPEGAQSGSASAINDAGVVVGQSYAPGPNGGDNKLRGFRWPSIMDTPQPLEFFDLPVGSVRNEPVEINSAGLIVGQARAIEQGQTVESRAVVWDESNIVYDLNTLVNNLGDWDLWKASDINDEGWIIGIALHNEGGEAGFLLIPVPEPAAGVMLVWFVLVVPFLRRREKRGIRAASLGWHVRS